MDLENLKKQAEEGFEAAKDKVGDVVEAVKDKVGDVVEAVNNRGQIQLDLPSVIRSIIARIHADHISHLKFETISFH